ncbi:MAG: DUF4856 domain-containing protein [Bacteroidota bacterium]
MKFKNLLLAALPIIAITFTSCSDDDASPEVFDYTTPDTYSFERETTSTVDFSASTSRLLMLDQMGKYISTQATASAIVDDNRLSAMFSNTGAETFFTGAALATGIQLKDKTAGSKDYFVTYLGGGTLAEQTAVRALFETQFDNAKLASLGTVAAPGVAGKYSTNRLFAANGLEPGQVLAKGMMGACLMDQIVNNYLSKSILDQGSNKADNTNGVLVSGKSYTAMEHAWDEAYGLIYGADVAATGSTAASYKFWSSYINQVNADVDFNTLRADIDLAFRTGRAAIVAHDYAERDNQAKIIKEKLAIVPAVRAVFYMNEGKSKLTTDGGAAAFHGFSEGYGFIMSLRYTNKPGTNTPYFTKAEVDAMLASLISGPNGLWDIDHVGAKSDAIALQIATRFGFTVEQAILVN